MKDQEKTEKSNQNPENEDFQAKCGVWKTKTTALVEPDVFIFIVKIGENRSILSKKGWKIKAKHSIYLFGLWAIYICFEGQTYYLKFTFKPHQT